MHIRLIKLTLILLSVIFSANLFAGVNALGQKFEILEDLSQTDEESSSLNDMFKDSNSIWKTISTGYGLKEKKSKSIQKKIRKYEKWYSQRPEYMERMLKRSERYLYHVANEVKKRNMPMEIALLPMIESAYNPIAKSNKKAVGLWQFISSTGKIYKLEQNWWIDDRKSVINATDAALNYLEKLYKDFGTWEHALAAYNAGEGRVGRSIKNNKRRKRSTDYYSLKLPRETRNYVPKLIAIRNIIKNPSKYNVYLPTIQNTPYFSIVRLPKKIDTELIPKFAEISMEEFQYLNAEYKRPLMNTTASSQYVLLPVSSVTQFNINLFSYDKPLASWEVYKPKKGERINTVAKKFGIDSKLIRQVNRLKGRKTFRRNSIVLLPKRSSLSTDFALNNKGLYSYDSIITHHVSAGDTLGYLSKKYKISLKDLMEFNELDSHMIIIGTTIDIPQ